MLLKYKFMINLCHESIFASKSEGKYCHTNSYIFAMTASKQDDHSWSFGSEPLILSKNPMEVVG